MSFNTDLIRARCAEIEESVTRLDEFRALSLVYKPRPFIVNRYSLFDRRTRRSFYDSRITINERVCSVFWFTL